jgi:uncharacterized protein DUF4282
MTDQSLGQDLPADWHRARSAARDPHFYGAERFRAPRATTSAVGESTAAAAPADRATSANGALRYPARPADADPTGFLGALFDFSFASFVTPRIIKVLYVLVIIGTVVSTLAFTIVVFKASAAFGVVTLAFADPLIILVVLAIARMFLEFFVVIFRAAQDIRALREGGGTH